MTSVLGIDNGIRIVIGTAIDIRILLRFRVRMRIRICLSTRIRIRFRAPFSEILTDIIIATHQSRVAGSPQSTCTPLLSHAFIVY